MGIFNRFGSQWVNLIEWLPNDNETMVYRFPCYRHAIRYGAKLTVREGQTAIFVNEGTIADVFPPGSYALKSADLPILSALQNWQPDADSPFKAEVYFFNTADFLSLKWRLRQSMTLTDADFGIVRLRAFGAFTMRINEPAVFLQTLASTDGDFDITKVSEQLTNRIVTCFPEVLAESDVSIVELPVRYGELAETVKQRVSAEFDEYGLEVGEIAVENISLPENVQKALDEKVGTKLIEAVADDVATEQAVPNTTDDSAPKAKSAETVSTGTESRQDKERQATESSNSDTPINQTQSHSQTQSQTQSQTPPTSTVSPVQPNGDSVSPLPKLYYLMIVGERNGPMTLKDVYRYLEQGEADADTLIWKKGMAEWQTIEAMPEVDLTQVSPPPPSLLNL